MNGGGGKATPFFLYVESSQGGKRLGIEAMKIQPAYLRAHTHVDIVYIHADRLTTGKDMIR